MENPPLLVLCHTVFNDALRIYPKETKHQNSARLLMKYIIEKQAELDAQGVFFSLTTQHVMGRLEERLPYTQGHPDFPAQMLIVLKNLIMSPRIPAKNQEESVIVLTDIISSRGEVMLVSNMDKMVKHTLRFYQDADPTPKIWKEDNIPFKIKNSTELVDKLREIDPDTWARISSSESPWFPVENLASLP